MSSAFDGLLFLQSSNDGSNLITVRLHYVIITAIYNLMDPNRAATWQYRKHHVQDLSANIVFNFPLKSLLLWKSN
ncbi:unnamed protein product [Rotaria sp. Silwood1]|nr:unnamed protein product [Rotaria sp. Silwood1]